MGDLPCNAVDASSSSLAFVSASSNSNSNLITDVKNGSEQPATLENFIRSDFWFADGNVVLIAGLAAFKVHRGQLERHSEVFCNLFSVPQPKEQELVDGCPCVELYDTPSDVFYLLSALYDGLYFKKPYVNDFPAIAAVLRLSTKYFIEHLRQRCLARLEDDWPSTLAGWDRREKQVTDEWGRYTPRESCAHPLLVINLALDLGLDSLLPSAFYDLSRYGPSRILSGTSPPALAFVIPDVAGQNADPDSHFESQYDPASQAHSRSDSGSGAGSTATLQPMRLSHENLCRIFMGREFGQRYIASFIDEQLKDRPVSITCLNKSPMPSPNVTPPTVNSTSSTSTNTTTNSNLNTPASINACFSSTTSQHCLESFYFIQLNILRSVGGIACGRDADPLFTLVQAREMLERTDFSDGVRMCGLRVCEACKREFREAVRCAREDIWARLPDWFGMRAVSGAAVRDGATDALVVPGEEVGLDEK